MSTDLFAVAESPAAVPDVAPGARPGSLDQVDNVDDEFLALIYSDEELLRHEFDDLMAAAWAGPPPADVPTQGAEHPPERPRSGLVATGERGQLAVDAGCRTRAARTRAPPDTPDGLPTTV